MGMYDSVVGKCPNCGAKVEWQSKADKCDLKTYTPRSVPIKIALAINKKIERCPQCGSELEIRCGIEIVRASMSVYVVDNFALE